VVNFMKIINLTRDTNIYTSNVYLITGTWNTLLDVNTLIDVGRDPSIIEKIHNCSTGVGKQKVEQVILTHSHYDHTEMLPEIIKEFNAKPFAYSPYLEGVSVLINGEKVKAGDGTLEIIHVPYHSSDSICLYSEEERVLFAGDSPLIIKTSQGCYGKAFTAVLERLVKKKIDTIYFGHGSSYTGDCNKMLARSLRYAKKSQKNLLRRKPT